jgi:ribonuclease Y
VFAVGAVVYARRTIAASQQSQDAESKRLQEQLRTSEQEAKSVLLAAKEEASRRREEVESEVRERRAEMARLEQRTSQREEGIERRMRELDSNEQRLGRRETELEALRGSVEEERTAISVELERVAALSQEEARQELLRSVEGELTPEIAERIRAADAQVREEAAERSREILIASMQRQASEQSGDASVTSKPPPASTSSSTTPRRPSCSAPSTRCGAKWPGPPSTGCSPTAASTRRVSKRWW